MNNNDLMIGVAGEHLACFDLISKGFTAFMTEQGLPYDLVADINGKLTKIQVKTTRTHSDTAQRKGRYPSYTFNIRKCGKGGRGSYLESDVDIFALVCVNTKQVCYVSSLNMPSTISIRVDEFRGGYLNEKQEQRAQKVFLLKSKGLTNSAIGREIGMDKSVVGRVLNGESKKTDHGVYFSDLTLDKLL
tara:strand:- start:670 stop:1236 length:567 start_codon:yes stop_codon:yes gene_type:complete